MIIDGYSLVNLSNTQIENAIKKQYVMTTTGIELVTEILKYILFYKLVWGCHGKFEKPFKCKNGNPFKCCLTCIELVFHHCWKDDVAWTRWMWFILCNSGWVVDLLCQRLSYKRFQVLLSEVKSIVSQQMVGLKKNWFVFKLRLDFYSSHFIKGNKPQDVKNPITFCWIHL